MVVSFDGHNLSGGEIQRLSLARLLLRTSANIWILDEPSIALDISNIEKVMDLLEDSENTLVIATHDLDILPHFDKIIIMMDGEIKEVGSTNLLSHDAYFKQVITMNRQS